MRRKKSTMFTKYNTFEQNDKAGIFQNGRHNLLTAVNRGKINMIVFSYEI